MRYALIVLVVASVFQSSARTDAQSTPNLVPPPTQTTSQSHVAWVVATMKRMESIKAGMTRKELLAVFTTEGGMSTPLRRTFVSRECPYFKVDVVFQAVGRPDRDQDGRVTRVEDERDVIGNISRPYLARSILD